MANIIKPKRSTVAAKVPTTAQMSSGEIAVNSTDQKIYTYDGTSILQIGSGKLSGLSDLVLTSLTTGQAITWNGTTWINSTVGNVIGPASATDNALARFDATTGKLIQNSGVTLDDNTNLATINSIQLDSTPVAVTDTEGLMYWNDADGNKTLNIVMGGGGVVQQVGEEQYFRIKASSAITNGQAVMFTGTIGASGALTGAPATGLTASTAVYFMGVATENIALNAWGYVTCFGLVRNIDTSGGAEAWVDGQILYYNPAVAGGLSKNVPSAPNAKIQVAAVVYASVSNGSLFIRPSFGGSLGQFEGDTDITSPANGQLLIRDQTVGTWKNATLTAGTGISITNAAGSITINATGGGGGGATVTTGTTAPSTPSAGDLWWNSEEGKLKIYYTDANTSQWVDAFVGVKGDTGPTGPAGTNGQGVATGGTVGQALVKNSSTDYDTSWSNIVAGSTTQIQYNDTGVLSASSNFTYNSTSGTLSLLGTDTEVILNGITNEPSSPNSGQLSLYSKNIGGRMMLKQKGPSGLDTPLQPSFYQNKVAFWSPPGTSTTVPAVWGFDAFSSIVASGSTTTARAVASTNILTRSKRLGYVSAAATNNYAGIFHPNAQWTVGDAAGLGGFYYVVRFALPAGNSSHAFFVGLGSGTAVQTNGTGVDPATITNSIGVGASVGDTNMRIMYGGSAAQTPITTNTNFSKTASTSVFELIMFAPTNTNNTVNYRLTRMASGSSSFEVSGTLTGTAGTALPANTTFLTPRIWSHCGAVTVAAQIDIISIYLETDY